MVIVYQSHTGFTKEYAQMLGKAEKMKTYTLAEAERQLTAGLGRRVTISPGKKKGKIALEYYDQEDLNRLLQALSSLEAGKERNL